MMGRQMKELAAEAFLAGHGEHVLGMLKSMVPKEEGQEYKRRGRRIRPSVSLIHPEHQGLETDPRAFPEEARICAVCFNGHLDPLLHLFSAIALHTLPKLAMVQVFKS